MVVLVNDDSADVRREIRLLGRYVDLELFPARAGDEYRRISIDTAVVEGSATPTETLGRLAKEFYKSLGRVGGPNFSFESEVEYLAQLHNDAGQETVVGLANALSNGSIDVAGAVTYLKRQAQERRKRVLESVVEAQLIELSIPEKLEIIRHMKCELPTEIGKLDDKVLLGRFREALIAYRDAKVAAKKLVRLGEGYRPEI